MCLSFKVLVGEGRSVHPRSEKTSAFSLFIPHHLWQQPRHTCPCQPVLTHRDLGGHVGLFRPPHPSPWHQLLERAGLGWGCRKQVVSSMKLGWPYFFTDFLTDPHCGPIPRIQFGYYLLCNSVILYQCHSGYKLLGTSSTSCDPNSQQWSPAPPSCQGTKTKLSSQCWAVACVVVFF